MELGLGMASRECCNQSFGVISNIERVKKRLILNEHTSSSIGQVTSHMWPNKVCVVYLFTLLHMFEWFIAWLLVNKGHQNDMSYNVNLFIIPCLVVNLT